MSADRTPRYELRGKRVCVAGHRGLLIGAHVIATAHRLGAEKRVLPPGWPDRKKGSFGNGCRRIHSGS